MNNRLSRRTVTRKLTLLQQFPRGERMQHKSVISAMVSFEIFAARWFMAVHECGEGHKCEDQLFVRPCDLCRENLFYLRLNGFWLSTTAFGVAVFARPGLRVRRRSSIALVVVPIRPFPLMIVIITHWFAPALWRWPCQDQYRAFAAVAPIINFESGLQTPL